MKDLARKAIRYEIGLWKSLYRWIFRRPRAPHGAQAHSYAGPITPLKVHPHIASDEALRIRYGISVDFAIPWEAVASVGTRIRLLPTSKTVQFEGDVLSIGVASQTNFDVVLREPMTVRLPKGTSEPFTALRFYVDDPSTLVTHAREKVRGSADRH